MPEGEFPSDYHEPHDPDISVYIAIGAISTPNSGAFVSIVVTRESLHPYEGSLAMTTELIIIPMILKIQIFIFTVIALTVLP